MCSVIVSFGVLSAFISPFSSPRESSGLTPHGLILLPYYNWRPVFAVWLQLQAFLMSVTIVVLVLCFLRLAVKRLYLN